MTLPAFPDTIHSVNLFQKVFCVFKYPKVLRHNSLKILILCNIGDFNNTKTIRDGEKWIGFSKSALRNYLRTTIKVHGAILLMACVIIGYTNACVIIDYTNASKK